VIYKEHVILEVYMNKTIKIRNEEEKDHEKVEEITRKAF
jgi:hypothetical protein